jgi:hypothetical protein
MKVLNNTGEIQTIRVIPRSYPSALTLTLRDDQTNDIDTYALNSGFSVVNDYLVIDNVYTLREFHFYDLTITDQDGDVIYKDRIFCTNQPIADFTVNDFDSSWIELNFVWGDYGQEWNGTSYISEPSNNDYIIL